MDGSLWVIIDGTRRRRDKLHILIDFQITHLEKRLAIKDQVENIINYEKWLYPN
jgi:hypothetical protein